MQSATAIVFRFNFSGTTYYAAIRTGISGWVLLDHGTVPETVINTAFTTLGAGARVVLLDATYTMAAAAIDFTANEQVLDGQGRGSFLDGDALPTGFNAINLAGFTDCIIRNLSVQTEDGGTKTCHCIYIADSDNFLVENVTIVNSDAIGIYVLADGGLDYGRLVNNNVIDTDEEGIHVAGVGGTRLTFVEVLGNIVQQAGTVGIAIVDADYCNVSKNTVTHAGTVGIRINSHWIQIEGNLCYLNVQHGISLDGAWTCTVSDNICALNDSGNTANYDGIYVDSGSIDNTLADNICYGNHRFGIGLGEPGAAGGFRNKIEGNTCLENDREGIYVRGVENQILDNTIYDNGQDTAGTYHGISLHEDSDRCDVSNNYINSPGDSQEDCIYLGGGGGPGACNVKIVGNYCYNGMGSGIQLVADNDECFIHGNYLIDNNDYGISITAATCNDNDARDNYYSGNGAGPINDSGTDTRLATIPLYIASYNVTDVPESEDGLVVDGVGEWVSFVGQLPPEVQQVVRFKIWGVGLAPPGAGNQMCLEIEIEGGASDEPKTTHDTGALTDQLTIEENFLADDIIHWVCTHANALALLGGDSVKCACRYNGVSGADIATNAAFRRVLVHVV